MFGKADGIACVDGAGAVVVVLLGLWCLFTDPLHQSRGQFDHRALPSEQDTSPLGKGELANILVQEAVGGDRGGDGVEGGLHSASLLLEMHFLGGPWRARGLCCRHGRWARASGRFRRFRRPRRSGR